VRYEDVVKAEEQLDQILIGSKILYVNEPRFRVIEEEDDKQRNT